MTEWSGEFKKLKWGCIFSYEGDIIQYDYGKKLKRKKENRRSYFKCKPITIGSGEHQQTFNATTCDRDSILTWIDPDSIVDVLFVGEPCLKAEERG